MIESTKTVGLAIVGGGAECKALMDVIFADKAPRRRTRLIGIACADPHAEGYTYAQEKGVYATTDYHNLYKLEDLNIIIELTGRSEVADEICQTKPQHVRVIDHVCAHLFWEVFQVEEKKTAELVQSRRDLEECAQRRRSLLENSLTGIYVDQGGKIVLANEKFARIYGYSDTEILGLETWKLDHPEDRAMADEIRQQRLKGTGDPLEYDGRGLQKDGETLWVKCICHSIIYKKRPALLGEVLDITKYQRGEEALKETKEELRAMAGNLEEFRIAFKVMLNGVHENRAELQQNMISSIKDMVSPYVQALKKSRLGAKETDYVNIIETHLEGIVSPFLQKLSSKYVGLTPKELQVASLVKEGKTSKEIADLLCVSTKAIHFHKANIRTKLGLKNTKVNLRSYLLTLG